MIALIFTSLLLLFFLTILGVFTTKVLRIPASLTEQILLGLVVGNTVASFLSLFFPLSFLVAILFALWCLILSFFIQRELWALWRHLYKKKYLFYALPFIAIALVLTLGRPWNYDTGLYHLQSIKWIEEYAVVPGLANLHGRFGFNPNIFPFFALTSFRDIFQQEIFTLNFTIFSVLAVYFVHTLYRALWQGGFSYVFVFFFCIFYSVLQLRENLPTPSPDFLANIIPLFVFARMLDIAHDKKEDSLKNYIPILILSVYIVTVKLSALPVTLISIPLFIRYRSELKKTLWILPWMGLIILPWLIRNIILTGWLIYPLPSLDIFHFDWQVPLLSVIAEKDMITGWARHPGKYFATVIHMDIFDWFPIWWQHIQYGARLSILGSFLFPILLLIGQCIKKIHLNFMENVIIFTSFIGVLFWLFMAPDWRFGGAFLAVALLSPLFAIKFSWAPWKPTLVFSVAMLLLIGPFVFRNHSTLSHNIYDTFVSQQTLLTPRKLSIPSDATFTIHTLHWVDIFLPSSQERCFNHSIPCTPYLDSRLLLRGETLESGFKIAGMTQ